MVDPSDENTTVALTFQLSKSEFVKGAQRGYVRSPLAFTLVPVSIAAGLLYAAHLRSHGSTFWIVLVVISIGWWPFFYFGLPGITFSSKATISQSRTTTFSAAGSHHHGLTYDFDRPWSIYRGCIEFPDMYVLRYALGNSTTFPKRAFVSPSVEDDFRTLVASHVPCHFSTDRASS